jgi:DNA-binding Lrp family transcriptional regulator
LDNLDNLDLKILYAMAEDMELSLEPYKTIGESIGIDEKEVITRVERLQERGIIKRIAPILYHQKTIFQYNALTIWSVEEERVEEIAEFLMSFKHISHVYEREMCEEWPYNLYGMLHGKKPEEIDQVVSQVVGLTGAIPYKVIYTTKEWKKTSPNLKYLLKTSPQLFR